MELSETCVCVCVCVTPRACPTLLPAAVRGSPSSPARSAGRRHWRGGGRRSGGRWRWPPRWALRSRRREAGGGRCSLPLWPERGRRRRRPHSAQPPPCRGHGPGGRSPFARAPHTPPRAFQGAQRPAPRLQTRRLGVSRGEGGPGWGSCGEISSGTSVAVLRAAVTAGAASWWAEDRRFPSALPQAPGASGNRVQNGATGFPRGDGLARAPAGAVTTRGWLPERASPGPSNTTRGPGHGVGPAPAGHPAAERCRPSERVRAANLTWLCEGVSGRSIPLLARVASTRRIAPSLIVA